MVPGCREPVARQHAALRGVSLATLLGALAFVGRVLQSCTPFLLENLSLILCSECGNPLEAFRCSVDLVGLFVVTRGPESGALSPIICLWWRNVGIFKVRLRPAHSRERPEM